MEMEEITYEFKNRSDNGMTADLKAQAVIRVAKIFAEKNTEPGAASIVYFYIVRQGPDIAKSFTLKYAFNTDYYDVIQIPRNVYTYVCERGLVGRSMLIKLHVPAGVDVSECVAYISEYETAETVCECKPLLAEKNGSLVNMVSSSPVVELELDTSGQTVRHIPDLIGAKSAANNTVGGLKSKIPYVIISLIFIAALVLFGMLGLDFARRVNYDNTIEAAKKLSEAGLYDEAESYAEDKLKGNKYYEDYKAEISGLADSLLGGKRYNEAYAIIRITPFASILQNVCESASADYISLGDYKNAYAYAYAAPYQFTEEVVSDALANAFDSETMTFNSDAYSVAVKGSVDDSATDELIHRIIDVEMSKNNYITALDTAVMLKNDKDNTAYEILKTAVENAVKKDNYAEAEYYLDTYSGVENCNTLAQDTFRNIYNQAVKDKDYDTAGEYARKYGYNFSGAVTVTAEDPNIRKSLAHSYFMLNESQKRTYHSNKIAVSNVLTASGSGRVLINEHGKTRMINNIASIASGDMFTAILHNDGTTELISRLASSPAEIYSRENDIAATIKAPQSGTVDIAVGEKHIVYLMANGTVKTSGDNISGQCSTDKWTDIVAIAAGADFTVGLKSDGTLVACGSNKCGQCDLSDYHNVVDVRACRQSTVLLFADGTVRVVGERSRGLLICNGWSNVKRIRAGANAVMAETNDDKYLFSGYLEGKSDSEKASGLSRLLDFEVGDTCIAYIKESGSTCNTKGYSIQK